MNLRNAICFYFANLFEEGKKSLKHCWIPLDVPDILQNQSRIIMLNCTGNYVALINGLEG